MGLFSPVFMMRGGDKAATKKRKYTKQKTTTAKRVKSVRREAGKKKRMDRPKAKAKKTRPLSVENQRKVDVYFIGRDFPNWNPGSQVPE
jgi:hypothetical protein